MHLVDIGLGPHLPAADRLAAHRRRRRRAPRAAAAGDDKYSQGVVGVVAGSATYPGAGVLCTGAALRTRPGLVRYAGRAADRRPRRLAGGDRHRRAARATPAACRRGWSGPGMGTDDAARAVLAEVLATDVPVLVDADALTLLAARAGARARPRARPPCSPRTTASSPGSARERRARDRIGAARRLAADLGAVVLLKGDATVVADADGTAFVNGTGTPELATAGTGDVLSGIAGALLATGLPRGSRRPRSPRTCTAAPGSWPRSAGR